MAWLIFECKWLFRIKPIRFRIKECSFEGGAVYNCTIDQLEHSNLLKLLEMDFFLISGKLQTNRINDNIIGAFGYPTKSFYLFEKYLYCFRFISNSKLKNVRKVVSAFMRINCNS